MLKQSPLGDEICTPGPYSYDKRKKYDKKKRSGSKAILLRLCLKDREEISSEAKQYCPVYLHTIRP